MQHIISFVGIKGGAGKSTIAVGVAAEWHVRGRRTLVVDLDQVQRSSLTWANNATANNHDAPTVIAMGDNYRAHLGRVMGDHEIVILDCPGRVDEVSTWALGQCDLGLMPCAPDGIEVAAMEKTLIQMRETRSRRPELDAAVLMCRVRSDTVAGRNARAPFAGTGVPLLRSQLELRADYNYAWTAGLGPTTYAATSKAAVEVRMLVDELERRLGMRRRKGALRAV